MPRIVALDVGDATIGVAATDELGLAVHPVRTIRRTASVKADLRTVEELLAELDASEVVVGLPVSASGEGPHPGPPHYGEGEEGPQAAKVRDFFDRLARRIRIPAVLWDESLSTVEAEAMLLEADVSRAKRRKVIDQMAAVVILRGYLGN